MRAPFLSRPDDVVTLGGAYGHVSADAVRAERLAGSPSSTSNYAAVIELSYKATMLPGWTVQPDLQYVFNPGQNVGGSDVSEAIPNALVLGLRTTLSF